MTVLMPTSLRPSTPSLPAKDWHLEGCLPNQHAMSRFALRSFPFTLGRDSGCDLQIASRNVSKRHASILHTLTAVIVQDLGSTNGTFVNGNRISDATPVAVNDLIQLADVEFRLCRQETSGAEFTCVAPQPEQSWLISRLNEVLNERRMKIFFQPIINAPDRSVIGYEALVRTDVSGLESPIALFQTATRLGQECRLSQICRLEAVQVIESAEIPGALFVNTHPNEELGPDLLQSMVALKDMTSHRQLVLEIHEKAIPGILQFRNFAAGLRDHGIQLAFDDFGAGQSRLLELAQVTPDFLKFDRSLVKDLGSPDGVHEPIVRSLHDTAVSLGIRTLAEGLETPESISVCDDIGFGYYQGFAFGRPAPVTDL